MTKETMLTRKSPWKIFWDSELPETMFLYVLLIGLAWLVSKVGLDYRDMVMYCALFVGARGYVKASRYLP